MVDMKLGIVTDSRSFKLDKIYLSHNQGVSLCNTTLAVLSVQHQTVHLFQVTDRSFLLLQEIGRFCYPDDPLIFSEVQYTQSNVTATMDGLHSSTYNPWQEKWYTSLKHRLLCRLLRQAEEACTPQSQAPMTHFYMNHDKFVSLKLWKMQLLDDSHLLLKYATEDVVTMRQSDSISQPALFGIYNIATTEFLHIYDNTSESLLRLYELNVDHFRTAVSHPHCQQISSVANSSHARALQHKFKQTMMGAKYGERMEATRRLLGQLPICCQSYSCSPYLDLSLFSYDYKWISALERPKLCCEDSSVK
jgi:de-etiolated-1